MEKLIKWATSVGHYLFAAMIILWVLILLIFGMVICSTTYNNYILSLIAKAESILMKEEITIDADEKL